jgi:hypothetical protein
MVGSPHAASSGHARSGAVDLIFGSVDNFLLAPGTVGSQSITQDEPNVTDEAESGDRFGGHQIPILTFDPWNYEPSGITGNTGPRFTPLGEITGEEGQSLTFAVFATDPDGPPPLTLSAENLPLGATFSDLGNGRGEFSWTPGAGASANNPNQVTLIATENGGSGGSAVLVVGIVVLPPGAGQQPFRGAPITLPGQVELEDYDLGGAGLAWSDNTSGNAGNVYRSDGVDIYVSANEGHYLGAISAGEWTEYTIEVASAGDYLLEVRYATPKTNAAIRVGLNGVDVTGALALTSTGAWQNWATTAARRIQVPTAGVQVLRITAQANGMNLNWVRFAADTAAPLQINNTPLVMDEGATGTISATELRYDDADTAATEIIYTITASPSHGALSHASFTQQDIDDGLVGYTHDDSENLADAMTFSVTDGNTTLTNRLFAFTMNPVNDNGPGAVPESLTVVQGNARGVLDGGASSVLANDSDADKPGDVHTAVLDTDVSNGTLTLNADGTFLYAHDGGDTVTDSFSYHVNDTVWDSNTVDVTITVLPPAANLPPSIDPVAPRIVLEGAMLIIPVSAGDDDGPLSELVLEAIDAPAGATFTDHGDGTATFTWTPSAGTASAVPFEVTFRATDLFGSGDSASALASITVIAPPPSGQQPFSGSPAAIPGRIEFEDYDFGGPGVAYNDFTAGNDGTIYRTDDVDIWFIPHEDLIVGANKSGEWLEFTVNVAAAGEYVLHLRCATNRDNRRIGVVMDGVRIGEVALPNTGTFEAWQTAVVPLTIANAGEQVLRIEIDTSILNLNWMEWVAAPG